MGRRFLVSLALLLCAEATLAQVATTSSTSTTTSSTIDTSRPVAYVYVSTKHYIHAYNAWAEGQLPSSFGSPVP